MHSQAPHDDASIQDRYTAGRLIRNKLEQLGLGPVADFFNQPGPAMADKPSVSMPRRRARPFTEMDAVVAEDGYSYERLAIARWFAGGNLTSPQTGELLPGIAVATAIVIGGIMNA